VAFSFIVFVARQVCLRSDKYVNGPHMSFLTDSLSYIIAPLVTPEAPFFSASLVPILHAGLLEYVALYKMLFIERQ